MTRTDVHAPASTDFDPDLYQVVGFFDQGETADPDAKQAQIQIVQDLRLDGYRLGSGSSRQCGHCGAHLRYAALLTRSDVKEYIYVGETCVDNRFDLSKEEFQKLRETARLNKDRAQRSEKIEALLTEVPLLRTISGDWDVLEAGSKFYSDFIADVIGRFNATGELSQRQIDAVIRAYQGSVKYREKIAASEAVKAAQIASGAISEVPEGRHTVVGTVVRIKPSSGPYGGYRITVKSDKGFSVNGGLPKAIEDVEEGQRVEFIADLTVANASDKFFGFFGKVARGKGQVAKILV